MRSVPAGEDAASPGDTPGTEGPSRLREPRGRPPGSAAGERGTITLMLLVMFVALLALAGIVIDGGAKLAQAENANAIAQEAARAGAGMVNQSKALATGSFTVDQAQALAAAQRYLARLGVQGTAVADGPEAIRVTVTMTAPTHVLSIIGIDSMKSTGSATASLVTGVTGPGA